MFFRRMLYSNYSCMHKIVEEDTERGLGALWLGDYTAASDKRLLKEKGVRTVVTTASGLGISYFPTDEITHKQYNLLDSPSQNISHCFEATFRDIDDGIKRGGVLVHCAAGISRSATCLIAYLMRKNNTLFRDTLNMVRSKRRIVCPNIGFERQLRSFEFHLMQQQKSELPNKQQQQMNMTVHQSLELNRSKAPAVENKTLIPKGDLNSNSQLNRTALRFQNNESLKLQGIQSINRDNQQVNSFSQENVRNINQKTWRLHPITSRTMQEQAQANRDTDNLQVQGINKLNSNYGSFYQQQMEMKGQLKIRQQVIENQYKSGPNIVTYNSKNDLRTSSRGLIQINSINTSKQNNLITLNQFRKRPIKNIYYT